MLYNYYETCFSLIMTDGHIKEFELVDFAEKLKNIQKGFIKEVLGSGTCFDILNFSRRMILFERGKH